MFEIRQGQTVLKPLGNNSISKCLKLNGLEIRGQLEEGLDIFLHENRSVPSGFHWCLGPVTHFCVLGLGSELDISWALGFARRFLYKYKACDNRKKCFFFFFYFGHLIFLLSSSFPKFSTLINPRSIILWSNLIEFIVI